MLWSKIAGLRRVVEACEQADRSLHDLLGLEPQPGRFVRAWPRQAAFDRAVRRRLARSPVCARARRARRSSSLRKEVYEPRRANEILKAASVFFAIELDQDLEAVLALEVDGVDRPGRCDLSTSAGPQVARASSRRGSAACASCFHVLERG